MSKTENPALAEVLQGSDYLRERLDPWPSDPLYLHLSDLRLGLGQALPAAGSRVLDFGCGGSPYRSLFNTPEYRRADFSGTRGVDFEFGEDSRISAPDASFDCVLSTQVLEHVRGVAGYLGECHRLLRPGGKLILTTHGTFQDHGCPYDFWRWTADGLRLELERARLKVGSVTKLTTGARALLFLNQQFSHRLVFRHRSWAAALLRVGRLAYTRMKQERLNTLADREYADCRVVPAEADGHQLYMALIATAVRPS